jgi:rhamnogalacturonyl hydrolase YesR
MSLSKMFRGRFAATCILSIAVAALARDGRCEAPPPGGGPASGETVLSVTADGAWSWFGDPRAVFHLGLTDRTYVAWVTRDGNLTVTSFDDETGRRVTSNVRVHFQADDHCNPSLLVRPDGRVMVFYAPHISLPAPKGMPPVEGIHYVVSRGPEDVSSWHHERRVPIARAGALGGTYPNPVQLPGEGDRIYLFWRGPDGWPVLSVSDDGSEWQGGNPFVVTNGQRPYFKVETDGRSEIHFAFTEGHPRTQPENGIYYVRYRSGGLYRADGRKIKDLSELPLTRSDCDTVYDGRGHGRAWLWDIAVDREGHPVIVYAALPSESDHRYRYARWDGERWQDNEITDGGGYFPQEADGVPPSETYYSGGVVLDHDDPGVVYLSRPTNGVFEIERWRTSDGGSTWSSEMITSGSEADNVRPVVVRGRPHAGPLVLWMNGSYSTYTRYATGIDAVVSPFGAEAATIPAREDVLALAARVCESALATLSSGERPEEEWDGPVFFLGVLSAYRATGEETLLGAVRNWADANRWEPEPLPLRAHDPCALRVYLDVCDLTCDTALAAKLTEAACAAGDPATRAGPPSSREALFMMPRALTTLSRITGDPRYLNAAEVSWLSTAEMLCDQTGRLVSGADGRVPLESCPGRERCAPLFLDAAERIAGLQGADGMWRSSQLDSNAYPAPDAEATELFCYTLAWGVNTGLLDQERFTPVVARAWRGLGEMVWTPGGLVSIQQPGSGQAPGSQGDHARFRTGAFLLAAAEVARLADRTAPDHL